MDVPYADALVERTGCYETGVWRDCDGRNTVFDAQSQNVLTGLNVPQADSAISTSGRDGTTITGKVERVDILFVTRKGISDGVGGNIPDLKKITLERS